MCVCVCVCVCVCPQELEVEPTLKALQKLSEDQIEIGEDGEVTITQPRKIRAIGLVDFPPR